MYTVRRITTATFALLCCVIACLVTATAAAAGPTQPVDHPGFPQVQPPQVQPTSTVITNGSSWWTFALAAAIGAVVAVGIVLLVARVRRSADEPVVAG